MEGMETPKSVKARERWLSDSELARVWMQAPECHRCFGPIVRLLIVTGQRREEISGLHWQELDRTEREMRLSGDRTKNGEPTTIPLNDLAIAELDKVAGGEKWPSRGRVFPTATGAAFTAHAKGKTKLDKLISEDGGSPMLPWRLHDLTPVVLHNRLYEGQHISVTGYANVGLQLFLPLGPRLALIGFDSAAYTLQTDSRGILKVDDDGQIALINDLQWEAAHAVLLASPDMPKTALYSAATHWASRRRAERTVFREEIVDRSDTEMRTRHGSGEAPSAVSLDLSFFTCTLPAPKLLAPWEIPPFRDDDRVARVDRAFERFDDCYAPR